MRRIAGFICADPWIAISTPRLFHLVRCVDGTRAVYVTPPLPQRPTTQTQPPTCKRRLPKQPPYDAPGVILGTHDVSAAPSLSMVDDRAP